MSKKDVLSYDILITKLCQRARVEFLVNSFFLKPMVPLIPHLGIEVRNRLRVPLVIRRRCVVVELRAKLVKVTQIQL